jgi:hypothetical protein
MRHEMHGAVMGATVGSWTGSFCTCHDVDPSSFVTIVSLCCICVPVGPSPHEQAIVNRASVDSNVKRTIMRRPGVRAK